ncbi:MAG: twin-arginine translocase TatA/TatE family subunit [Clostridium sp.]|nr:twin-arginine translocase TatA/TatE family subunit [Clostridium sp.]
MPRLGPTELIVILVIALVIFGPSKLPSIGKSIGVAINEFKTSMNKVTDDVVNTETEDQKDAKTN